MKKAVLVILLLFVMFTLPAFGEPLNLDDPLHPLGQDISKLTGKDGTISKLKKMSVSNDDSVVYRFSFMSKGNSITGFAVIPQKAVNGDKLPVVVYGRGANAQIKNEEINDRVLKRFQSMAVTNDYIFLAPELRSVQGSDGTDTWGGAELNDYAAMALLAKSLAYVDTDNIFFLGFSRGGTRAFMLAAMDVPFRGIISVAGISDLYTQYPPETDAKWKKVMERSGVSREKNYETLSAVKWSDKIHTPLLIVQGDSDRTVSPMQSKILAKELEKLGKTYELAIIKGADHQLLFENPEEFDAIAFPWMEKTRHK